MPVDLVVEAMGQGLSPELQKALGSVALTKRGNPHQEAGFARLAQKAGVNDQTLAGTTGVNTGKAALSYRARLFEQFVDRIDAAGVQSLREGLANHRTAGTEQLIGPGVGFKYPATGLIDDQHGVIHHVEEFAVAGFHLTQAPVVLFQRLLGIEQLLPQVDHRAQVATEGQQLIRTSEVDKMILDGEFGAVGQPVHNIALNGCARVPAGPDDCFLYPPTTGGIGCVLPAPAFPIVGDIAT